MTRGSNRLKIQAVVELLIPILGPSNAVCSPEAGFICKGGRTNEGVPCPVDARTAGSHREEKAGVYELGSSEIMKKRGGDCITYIPVKNHRSETGGMIGSHGD